MDKEPTIDDILEAVRGRTRNHDEFIRPSIYPNFIENPNDRKKAAAELSKRDFQVQNIVIQELSEMTSKDFEGKAGKQAFEDSIKSQLNPLMQEGRN